MPTSGQIEHVLSYALCLIEDHCQTKDGSCSCGFCAWSVDHVLIMTMREGQEQAARQAGSGSLQ